MRESWSPAVQCPACLGVGYYVIPEMDDVYEGGELLLPGNGECCLVCEECERTGIVTKVAAAVMLAKSDQASTRAIMENMPELSQAMRLEAEHLERMLDL
jgi:hypothetical protein